MARLPPAAVPRHLTPRYVRLTAHPRPPRHSVSGYAAARPPDRTRPACQQKAAIPASTRQSGEARGSGGRSHRGSPGNRRPGAARTGAAPFRPLPESLERAYRHLDLTRREFGPDHENTIRAEQSVITLAIYSDRYNEAFPLDLTRREFGPDHENTIRAEQSVITLAIYSDRYNEAFPLAKQLAGKSEAVLGAEHRLALATKFSAAYCTFKVGAVDEGLAMLDCAAEESARVLGSLDSATMHRRITIIGLLAEVGQAGMARERLIALQKECDSFPPEHFITSALRHAVQQLRDS